jgi:O-methyltransferase
MTRLSVSRPLPPDYVEGDLDLVGGKVTYREGDHVIGIHPIHLYSVYQHYDNFVQMVKEVLPFTRMNPDKMWAVKQLSQRLPQGCVIECGVYRGGSALLWTKFFPNRNYYFYDTFTGAPPTSSENDNPRLAGDFARTSYEFVAELLDHVSNVHILEGFFPNTWEEPGEDIAFIHLDLDTYTGIMAGLELAYPRMAVGGMIVVDDYKPPSNYHGVAVAVSEFMKDKEEPVLHMAEQQAVIIKQG